MSSMRRLAGAGAAGLVGLAVAAAVGPWWLIPLAGWIVASLVYVSSVWRTLWLFDADETARHAQREDPDRAATDLVLLSASIVSLPAIGLVLVRASHVSGLAKAPTCTPSSGPGSPPA